MRYCAVSVWIFLTELIVKNIVEKKGKIGVTKPLCGGKILLRKSHNQGFAMNLLEKRRELVAWISLFLTLLMTIGALLFGRKWNRMIKAGLALVLGGAYSNTYDRMFRNYVVDYISFNVKNKKMRQIVFNMADFCIMIGAIFVVIGGKYSENISKGQICSKGNGGSCSS